MVPRLPVESGYRLTRAEREEISRRLATGASCHEIATALKRAPSTISREIQRTGSGATYRAWRADARARRAARRPRVPKLVRCRRLRRAVIAGLTRRWSPAQICARLRRDFPTQPEMWVSHETIYQALFVQGRGTLRRVLTQYLRTGRPERQRQGRAAGRGRLVRMVMIADRPADVADRAVPGHWEGDLLLGRQGQSAIATLVERQSRYLLLQRLPAGRTAEVVRRALARRIRTLPQQLRRSLTWDQGSEMAQHAHFTMATGVQVYFCDPHSPWQRGTAENTNGLLRQYLPRTTDLARVSQRQLDRIARQLNTRPRHTLDWETPATVFSALVR
jgi:IS30 family transposase